MATGERALPSQDVTGEYTGNRAVEKSFHIAPASYSFYGLRREFLLFRLLLELPNRLLFSRRGV